MPQVQEDAEEQPQMYQLLRGLLQQCQLGQVLQVLQDQVLQVLQDQVQGLQGQVLQVQGDQDPLDLQDQQDPEHLPDLQVQPQSEKQAEEVQGRPGGEGQCDGICVHSCSRVDSSHGGRSARDDDGRDSEALHGEVAGGAGRGHEEGGEGGEEGDGRGHHGKGEVEEGDGTDHHDKEEVEEGDGRDHRDKGVVEEGDDMEQYDDMEGDEVLLADEPHLVSVHGNPDHELPQKILGRLL